MTTMSQYEEAATEAESWHMRRAARLEEFTAVEVCPTVHCVDGPPRILQAIKPLIPKNFLLRMS